ANTWFNNHATPIVKIPFLNRNEYGVNIGGPVKKDKLFFFGDYEAFRNHTSPGLNNTVPAHDDYLQGIFRYLGTVGLIHNINVMNPATAPLKALTIDPVIQSAFLAKVPSASNVNNFNVGNSSSTALLNTAGWLRNQAANTDRDIWLGKVDYEV